MPYEPDAPDQQPPGEGSGQRRLPLAPRPLTEPHPARLPAPTPRREEILAVHAAALEAGEAGYADPATGLFVLTAAFLADRGTCCGRGCRHCPTEPDRSAPVRVRRTDGRGGPGAPPSGSPIRPACIAGRTARRGPGRGRPYAGPVTRGALLRYRVMAWVTGVMLLLLVLVAMPLKYVGDDPTMVSVVGVLHGWLYVAYLATAFQLAYQLRWGPRRAVLVLLAGTVPFASFVAERSVVAEARSRPAPVPAGD
jgi:integral membrane protein